MKLLVADASALVEYLLRTETGFRVGEILETPDADVHVPALCDVEILSVLRKLTASDLVSESRAGEAIADLVDLPVTRHTHEHLLSRAFALRQNLTAYDAVYVALAEALSARLLTSDRALAAGLIAQSIDLLVL